MTTFTGEQSKYWYAYRKNPKKSHNLGKLLGKAKTLKNLIDKFGSKDVIYSKARYLSY